VPAAAPEQYLPSGPALRTSGPLSEQKQEDRQAVFRECTLLVLSSLLQLAPSQQGRPNQQQQQLLTSPAVTAAGRVADVILAANNGPVLQLSAQGDDLLSTDCWQDG